MPLVEAGGAVVTEVAVEVDVNVERHERQTLWLVEVKVENLPDLFNISPNLHFQWNSLLAMGH